MPTNHQQRPFRKKPLNDYARFSALGLQMGIIIFLFVYGGLKSDEWLRTSFPVCTLAGSILGVAAALYFVIRQLNNKR